MHYYVNTKFVGFKGAQHALEEGLLGIGLFHEGDPELLRLLPVPAIDEPAPVGG